MYKTIVFSNENTFSIPNLNPYRLFACLLPYMFDFLPILRTEKKIGNKGAQE